MHITLNGEPRPLDAPCSVEKLLRQLSLDRAPCAVEVNAELVPKRRHGGHEIREGDVVEIVTLVGGG